MEYIKMQKKSTFKKVPKRYQPKGMEILFEDHHIIVINKVAGLLTIGTKNERFKTVHSRLNDYVRKGNYKSRKRVFVVHRLDRDTSGILVFAKNIEAKQYLQKNWKLFEKKYAAVVHGKFKEKEGIITSYLVENKIFRMYSVDNPEKGKFSKTGYKVIRENKKFSLLEINLFTGRKNQIRVHLADTGHSVVGDKNYGNDKGAKRLALHSALLKILHPITHEEMIFETDIPNFLMKLIHI